MTPTAAAKLIADNLNDINHAVYFIVALLAVIATCQLIRLFERR